jgi:hypothetical protein
MLSALDKWHSCLYIENNLAAYTIIQRVYLSWFKYEVALATVSIIKKTNDHHLQ